MSSKDKIDVRAELIVDDVWEAEYDKTGFLSDLVDSSYQLFFKKQPITFPMVQISTKYQKYDKWG